MARSPPGVRPWSRVLYGARVSLAVGAAITPLLTRHWDKRTLMTALMASVGLLSCLMFFIPADMVWAIFALNMLIGVALGPKSPLAFSMYADSADYTEWSTGRRATGSSAVTTSVV